MTEREQAKRSRREIINYAIHYLWQDMFQPEPEHRYYLHRGLNFLICDTESRLHAEFGEVTNKDIALAVEAWILAQGTGHDRKKPLRLRHQPEAS